MRRLRFGSAFSLGRGAVALALLAGTLGTSGCGREAVVQSQLPLRRVVIYRNGIAYFERAGHVEDPQVRFKMKDTEVGDFLATLAVMERGGSSVKAAAFPLKMDDDNDDAKDKKKPLPKDLLQTVVLSLDGRAHDLQVGYVAESPVWRPTYRVVVQPNGEADLQAWGVVENLSGEDWNDVQLSLVAGAPIAFEAQLGRPIIPQRPIVTDEGEVMAVVPRGEMSLAQQEQGKDRDGVPQTKGEEGAMGNPAPAAAAPPAGDAEADDETKKADKPARRGAGRGAVGSAGPGMPAPKAAAPYPAPAPPPPPPSMAPSGRNVRSLAAVAAEGGTTRYDIPTTLSIPDKSATMVLLVATRVKGESIMLFAPDGGVPDSSSHPFRVVRFVNGTPGILERGPIAVFESNAFLGQGMLDPLPAAATATVPFALDRAVAIDLDRKFDETGERVAKIENSQLWVERDARTLTKYRIKNGGDKEAKIVLKHARIPGARLFQPPPGTDDNVGTNTALVPASVKAKDGGELTVDERSTIQRWEDWFSDVADNAVKSYIADPRADKAVVAKLSAAWTLRNEIKQRRIAQHKTDVEAADVDRGLEETRRNLKAIEKSKGKEVDDLRAKLTKALNDMVGRSEVLRRERIENNMKLTEIEVRFREEIREIKVTDPLPPPK